MDSVDCLPIFATSLACLRDELECDILIIRVCLCIYTCSFVYLRSEQSVRAEGEVFDSLPDAGNCSRPPTG